MLLMFFCTSKANESVNSNTNLSLPIANNDRFGTSRASFVVDILRNDIIDISFPITSINIVTAPKYGTISVVGTTPTHVVYTVNNNYTGFDTFEYTITNSLGVSNVAKVEIQIIKGSEADLVQWISSDLSPTTSKPEIEGFTLTTSSGISVGIIVLDEGLDEVTAFNFTGFPVSGGIDLNKYVQLGFKLKNNEIYTTELRKFYADVRSEIVGAKYSIKYSKDPNFLSNVFDFSLGSSLTGSFVPIDPSFNRQFPIGETTASYDLFLFPEESVYVRIYVYDTSGSFYLKYPSSKSGPKIRGILSDYYPETCTQEVAWNGAVWPDGRKPKINQKVVLYGDYNTSVNDSFEACSLHINPGKKLIISKNKYVKVDRQIENNGDIEVQSDGNLVQVKDDYTNIGANIDKVVVKREALLKRLDYNFWGAPVLGQNLRNFSPGTLLTRFYKYNESNDYFDGVFVRNNYPNGSPNISNQELPATYEFQPGIGYGIRASNTANSTTKEIFTGQFVGNPFNGAISVPINKSSDEVIDGKTISHGYNLIANPYASNIDFELFYALNNTLINKVAYFWTNTNYNPEMQGSQYPKAGIINNYAVYTGSGGVPAPYGFKGDGNNDVVGTPGNCSTCKTPTKILKVGQGFLISAKNSGTLVFNNSVRTTSNSGIFMNVFARTQNAVNGNEEDDSIDRFWLELKTPINFVTPILIAYVNGATDEFDKDYDAEQFSMGADSFYSILGDKKMVVQGKKKPMIIDDRVSLGAIFYQDGEYTISLSNQEGVFSLEQPIILHDKYSNNYTDLKKSVYKFYAAKGEDLSRFEIVYKTEESLGVNNQKNSKFIAFQSLNNLILKSDYPIENVWIYDALGRTQFFSSYNENEVSINVSHLMNGMFWVTAKTKNGLVTKKVLIGN